jgi:hypothetical protein
VLVEGGGEFEVHGLGGGLALGGDLIEEGLASGAEEVEDALGLGGVLLRGAALGVDGLGGCGTGLAGLHALLDVAEDAAGVGGVGLEVFVASAEEEEVKDGVAVAIGGGAGGEGAEGLGEGFLAEAVGGVDAGMFVRHGDAEEVRGVETEAAACGFGTEGGAGGVVEKEGGFEVGAGAGVVDGADFFAEVEAFGEDGFAGLVCARKSRRRCLRRAEEAAETAAEVGGVG